MPCLRSDQPLRIKLFKNGHLPIYNYKRMPNPDLEVRPVKIVVE